MFASDFAARACKRATNACDDQLSAYFWPFSAFLVKVTISHIHMRWCLRFNLSKSFEMNRSLPSELFNTVCLRLALSWLDAKHPTVPLNPLPFHTNMSRNTSAVVYFYTRGIMGDKAKQTRSSKHAGKQQQERPGQQSFRTWINVVNMPHKANCTFPCKFMWHCFAPQGSGPTTCSKETTTCSLMTSWCTPRLRTDRM